MSANQSSQMEVEQHENQPSRTCSSYELTFQYQNMAGKQRIVGRYEI